MTDTLTYLRAYKDQDLFTLPICKSVSDLFLAQYKWQKDPFIPLHYLNPICIERQINYLWQGKGRGVYKKNLKNIYCTGSLDVKHMSSAVWVFFPQFFFLMVTNTPLHKHNLSKCKLLLTNKTTSAQEASTRAQWQSCAESPSGVWEWWMRM